MTPCVVPVLLVPKKDGRWGICVDCRAINNITVNYCHHIPRLDDMLDELHGFIVSADDIKVDQETVKAIEEWVSPKAMSEVRSFHGLDGFYRRFMDFSTIAAPLNRVIKKYVGFKWEEAQQNAFQYLKEKLTQSHLLILSDFTKTFEIECDASGIGIGSVLMQERRPIAYFSEKLGGATPNYETYDHKLYVLLSTLDAKLLGFEQLKEMHETDSDFQEAYKSCEKFASGHYFRQDGFLFYDNCLCVPNCSLRDLFVRESHGESLMGHLGISKTLKVLQDHYFWRHMKKDVERVYGILQLVNKRSPKSNLTVCTHPCPFLVILE
ncbi:hypothetical protein N665_0886s0005 [Sinapis alba]|nr:hypothetical protein N665_0886s0005 [Sinapis alba]